MNFDPDLIVIFGFSALMAIGYPLARAFGNRIASKPDRDAELQAADLRARLERIEQMVETTSVEVERLAEGQRFTAKLLADRVSPPER